MRLGLVGSIILGVAVVAAITEVVFFNVVTLQNPESALLGGLWLAVPYLAVVGLALLVRKYPAPLTVLLVMSVIASAIGLWFLFQVAQNQADADRQVKTAVLPGEDPSRGPAAMRKTGADLGHTITSFFSILIAVVVPPIQLGLVLIPTLIAWALGLAVEKERPREEPEYP